MIEKVYDYMKKTGMSDNTKTIVAGLSGGADSVCLVMVLKRIIEIHRLGINIVTVHVNHGIRGEEAERDEKFAKEFAHRTERRTIGITRFRELWPVLWKELLNRIFYMIFMESYLTSTRRRYMKMLYTMIYLSARLPMNTVYQGREYMI